MLFIISCTIHTQVILRIYLINLLPYGRPINKAGDMNNRPTLHLEHSFDVGYTYKNNVSVK